MTPFTHGLLIGLAAPVLLAVALSALALARAEAHSARPTDDPYRDERHAAQQRARRRRRAWFHIRKHLIMSEGEDWQGRHLA